MANLKIDTEAVKGTAKTIKKNNDLIKNGFVSVRNAITKLDSSWESPASGVVIGKFNDIDNKYTENRYTVMNNYVNFLYQQIQEGYESTEQTNKSLADAFK